MYSYTLNGIRLSYTLFFTFFSDATVTLERSELVVIEGNNTQNSTLEVCVILVDISGGLRREIAVDGLYMNNTATGTYNMCAKYI